jgi:hypothetical protein
MKHQKGTPITMTTLINVKNTTTNRKITLEHDFGRDLADAMKKFDHGVIHALFIDAAVIQRAGQVRPVLGIKKGADGYKTDETLKAEQKTWKPKIGRTADPVKKKARILRGIETLPKAERDAVMAQLMKLAGAGPKLVKTTKKVA